MKGINNMDTIDSIIINAQILALVQAKNKIQERIDELEKQKEENEDGTTRKYDFTKPVV